MIKKIVFCLSLSFLVITNICSSEKPFVSQPSEYSADLLQQLPSEVFWQIIMQLTPLEALEVINNLEHVSRNLKKRITNSEFLRLKEKKLFKPLVQKVNTISKEHVALSQVLFNENVYNLSLFFSEALRDHIGENNNLFNVEWAYNGEHDLISTAIYNLGHPGGLEKFKYVVDNAPPGQLDKVKKEDWRKYTPLKNLVDRTVKLVVNQIVGNQKKSYSSYQKTYNTHLKAIEYLLTKGVLPSITGLKGFVIVPPEIEALIKKYGGDPENI